MATHETDENPLVPQQHGMEVDAGGAYEEEADQAHHEDDSNVNDDYKFTVAVCVFELIFIILYAVGVTYADGTEDADDHSLASYSTYQDVHVMMFIGFGFLMTFLRRYAFGAVSFNLLICAFVTQWALLIFGVINQGVYHAGKGWGHDLQKVHLTVESLLDADLATAACLISFGAVLGRTNPLQLMIMAFIEVPLYALNFYICTKYLLINDIGGSMVVHAFGCYFGLAVSLVIGKPATKTNKQGEPWDAENKSLYHSDLFSMIGSVFLWLFWPSFNGYFADGSFRERAFINTVVSLSACTVTVFGFSKLWSDNKGKFEMMHIQNSVLAGGVAIGASADLYVTPAGAMAVGIVAGMISVFGYAKMTPWANENFIYDTCGINNLHGMPAIFAAIVSAITIGSSGHNDYDSADFPFKNGSFSKQAGYQMAGLFVSVSIAIIGGLVTGAIMKADTSPEYYFVDSDNFVVPLPGTSKADFFASTVRGGKVYPRSAFSDFDAEDDHEDDHDEE